VVRYQPVVKLYDERIVGFERSSTGNIPRRDWPPDSFLPVAIETGFIEDVERWVREQAFGQIGVAMGRTICPTVPRLWDERQSFERSVADPHSWARWPSNHRLRRPRQGRHRRDQRTDPPRRIGVRRRVPVQLSDLGVRRALEKFGSSFSPSPIMHRFSLTASRSIDPSPRSCSSGGNYVARRVDL